MGSGWIARIFSARSKEMDLSLRSQSRIHDAIVDPRRTWHFCCCLKTGRTSSGRYSDRKRHDKAGAAGGGGFLSHIQRVAMINGDFLRDGQPET
jgi:hypothetical protein